MTDQNAEDRNEFFQAMTEEQYLALGSKTPAFVENAKGSEQADEDCKYMEELIEICIAEMKKLEQSIFEDYQALTEERLESQEKDHLEKCKMKQEKLQEKLETGRSALPKQIKEYRFEQMKIRREAAEFRNREKDLANQRSAIIWAVIALFANAITEVFTTDPYTNLGYLLIFSFIGLLAWQAWKSRQRQNSFDAQTEKGK